MNNEPAFLKATHGIAIGGASSPAWLPILEGISQIAAALLPILSIVWLIVQILGYFRKSAKKSNP